MSELIGNTLSNRYQILSLLGEGGMGSVYKGRDQTLERDVAIKIMHRHNLGKQEFQQRFLQEARAAARLNHPGIVQVFDFDESNDLLYIVMEYILGENLDQMMRQLRRKGQWLVLDEAVELVRQTALALDYGHRQGVVHRDIKPANIMIKAESIGSLPYRPVITDLGLAKLTIGEGLSTQSGLTMGTPAYMAPEQIRGNVLDARSDIYSLGILLYELAVGQLPFAVKTFTQIVHDHLHQLPPHPHTVAPDLPASVVAVIYKALAKTPEERHATAGDFAQALEELNILPALVPPTANAGAGNLLTEHHASLPGPADVIDLVERWHPSPPPEPVGPIPYLRICTPDQRDRVVALTAAQTTIGRQPDNTVSLDDEKIARYHATIDHDEAGYWVVDLDSATGVYLGQQRLPPHTRTTWDPQLALRIGDYEIFLHQDGNYAVSSAAVLKATTDEVPLAATPMTLLLAQSEFAVIPGQRVNIPITLHNQGTKSEQFYLTVAGIPREWIISPLPTASLSPGAHQTVTLIIAPPRSSETTAQHLPLQIQVNSQQSAGLQVQTQCMLHIAPYTQFQSATFWGQGRRGRHLKVHVANQGNAPQVYQISWHDTGGTLAFNPPMVTIQAPPGKEVMTFAQVRVQPQSRRLLGASQQHIIQTQVIASNSETQTHELSYVSRPVIPAWLVTLLAVLSISLLVGLGWYWRRAINATPFLSTTSVEQAVAPTTLPAPAPSATPVAATATPVPPTATPLRPTPTVALVATVTPLARAGLTVTPSVADSALATVQPALGLTTASVSQTLSPTAPVTSTVALSSGEPLSSTPPGLSTPTVDFPLLLQGYAITNASTDGQNDVLVLSKPGQGSTAEWQWFDSLPAAELAAQRRAGVYITQLVYYKQRWGVGLASAPGYTDQMVLVRTEFPQATVLELLPQDYYITQLVYGGNQWVVVLSKGAGFANQTWNIEVELPLDVIDRKRAEGFALTQLAYGNGIWLIVMTKGVALQGQEVLTSDTFPEGRLRQKQVEGKYLTHLLYADSLWVAVVSAGTDVTEQIWMR